MAVKKRVRKYNTCIYVDDMKVYTGWDSEGGLYVIFKMTVSEVSYCVIHLKFIQYFKNMD